MRTVEQQKIELTDGLMFCFLFAQQTNSLHYAQKHKTIKGVGEELWTTVHHGRYRVFLLVVLIRVAKNEVLRATDRLPGPITLRANVESDRQE